MIPQCEACEAAPVDTIELEENPDDPYYLCAGCYARLHAQALRPLEWYNLARRHGPYGYLLGDDCYDNGVAREPHRPVESPRRFPAPTLRAASRSAESLFDFSVTRRGLNDKLVAAWTALPADEVMAELSSRYAATRKLEIRSCVLECAAAVGPAAAELVRSAWGEEDRLGLVFLAGASAACLPFREGFDRVRAAVDALDVKDVRQQMLYFHDFHTPEVLDWIEARLSSPVTVDWGRLAAASMLDWPRAERWLSSGRPLSLVALDALVAIATPGALGEYSPRLHHPSDARTLQSTLTAYAQRDDVPRVEKATSYLLAHLDVLAGTRSPGRGFRTRPASWAVDRLRRWFPRPPGS